jgi:Ca2+-binding RTX toxin-like protein
LQPATKNKGESNKLSNYLCLPTYNTTTDIQRELHKIMANRAADADLQSYSHIKNRPTFSLTQPEIDQTYQNVVKSFEDTITRLFGDTTVFAPSKERAVLISLAYQGAIRAVRSKLQQAMVTDNNRAEAWYLIRYKAIGKHYGANDGDGHAKRHYYEAQVFGLYDNPSNVTLAEAEQAYRMLTKHRDTILKYEKLYGTDPHGASPDTPAQRIAAANNDFGLMGADQVQTLGQVFNAAKGILLANLQMQYTTLAGLNANDYRSTDILMAPNPAKDSTLQARDGDGRSAKNMLIGTDYDDILTGGTGNDILIGKGGNNTYILKAGDASDRIITEASATQTDEGRIMFTTATGRQVVASGGLVGTDGVRRGAEGVFTYTLAGSTLTITIAGESGTITVENFQAGDLGISLGTAAVVPDTLLAGTSAPDVLYGSIGPNGLDGAGGADYLFGKAGNDHLLGGEGNDWVAGGAGGDRLDGGAGNDLLVGGSGHDVLYGGPGNDFMASYGDDDVVPFAPSGDLVQDQNLWVSTYTNWEVVLGPIVYDTANIELDGEYDGQYNILPAFTSLDGGSSDVFRETLYGGPGNDNLSGGGGDDYLSGDADNDTLFGFGGNDILEGGHGTDRLMGGVGDDALLGGDEQDTLSGERGNDTLFGGGDNDILEGDSLHPQLTTHGNDVLFGDAGADNLAGQGGDDILIGGTEDDVLYGDHDALNPTLHGHDVLYGDEGNDQLVGDSGNDVLYGGTDNDTLYGDGPSLALAYHGNDVLDGGDGDDFLWGDGGDDTLFGGADNDQLVGGTGIDTLEGGLGDDVLAGDAQDQVIVHAGEGVDTILRDPADPLTAITLDVGIDPEALQFSQMAGTDGSQFLALTLSPTDQVRIQHGLLDLGQAYTLGGTALTQRDLMGYAAVPFNITGSNRGDTIYGGGGNDTVNANEGNDLLDGGAGNDNLRGHAGDDTLLGGAGDDLLHGFEGADILDGGGGNDLLYGKEGNDTYRFGRDASADTIDDSDATAGNLDTISLAADVTPGAVSLHRHGNDLILSIDESTTQLTVLDHFVETTLINGVPVNDYNLVEQIAFADGTVWDKTAIAQRAIVLGPPNALVGGPEDDTFVVDNTLDTVTESPNQGTDTIQSSVSYTLPTNVENLTLTGYLNLNATGNALDNVLTGNRGNNVLHSDTDALHGDTGADTLIGGAGDDRYTINDDDTVVEAADEGIDWVMAGASYTLPAHVENGSLRVANPSYDLTPTLWGNDLDNILIGHEHAGTYLKGGAGADTMVGGTSADTYEVDDYGDTIVEVNSSGTDTVRSFISYTLGAWVENLVLIGGDPIHSVGNDLDNVLTGNNANNNLSGGLGADRLIGGAGDDTYDVDQAGDVVVESANAGTDTVFSVITYTLGANVEHLTLSGTAAIDGTGNSLANTLTGNSANNTLDGGLGADTLLGAAGDDLYVVDETDDSAIENANEGTDTVVSAVTYSLSGTHVERLTLSGTAAIDGTGNSLDNILTGNSADNTLTGSGGNDVLDGVGGNDILKGGAGADVYRFGPGSGQDTVNESSAPASEADRVEINSQPLSLIFSRLGSGSKLQVSLHGTSDTLTVQDWYSDTSRQTEVFQAADGRSLLHTQVEQLIQAMATFSTNNGGISWSQAIQERPDDVQAVLAAYWQPAS